MTTHLEMKDITKRFPGVLANDAVSLEVAQGEIHALLGENGAGKSTLMNILYGLYAADSGTVFLKGKPVQISSPKHSLALGIGMIHQEFMLVAALSVVENMVLGTGEGPGPFLDLAASAQRLRELAAAHGLKVDPWAKVADLSVGELQRVEILKALYRGAELLILDEPTAVLTPQETNELFEVLRHLVAQGHTVIFISHKLNEVMAISDRVTVLRGGRAVATLATSSTSPRELARLMVGREVFLKLDKPPAESGRELLSIEGLTVVNRGLTAVKDVSVKVRAGEVHGIAGVDGNGQRELVEAVTGLMRARAGRVRVSGRDVTNRSPRHLVEAGVAHIPANRQAMGLILDMSLAENVILEDFAQAPYSRRMILNDTAIRDHALKLIKEYDIRTPSEAGLVRLLSGGNQQKVILARELCRQPAVLVASHPTRGLDVGATEYIHRKIIEERDRGCAVLLVSTELEEVLALSDIISVMYEGEIMGTVSPDEITIEELGLMMAGSHRLTCSA